MKTFDYPRNYVTPGYMAASDTIVPIYPFQLNLEEEQNEPVLVNGVPVAPEVMEHWRKKSLFLKSHAYQKAPVEFVRLKGDDIRRSLANTRQLTLEVTDACNLKCRYCGYGEFYEDHDERTDRYMNPEDVIALLDYLVDLWNSPLNNSHGTSIYISFYGGEPLLNMDFIRSVVSYFERTELHHNSVIYSMTTNAILLRKNIDYLVEKDFRVLVSLDGNKENNGYRVNVNGESSFDRVDGNLRYVKEKYPEYFDRCINFNSVLHNLNSVSSIHHYIKDTYGKSPAISELNNTGIRASKREEFDRTYRNARESLYQAEDYAQIKKDMFASFGETMDVGLFLTHHAGVIYHSYNDFFESDRDIRRTPTGTCMPFSKKIFVTVTGKILTCERIGQQFWVGRVIGNTVELDFDAIANRYNRYYKKMDKYCRQCYNMDTCIQCVYNLKDIDTNPRCEGFENKRIFNEKLNRIMSYLNENEGVYERMLDEFFIEI